MISSPTKSLSLILIIGMCALLPAVHADQSHSLIQPYEDNPFYLAWDGVPVFPVGAAGIHSWYPLSGFDDVPYQDQIERLAAALEDIDSPHVCGFVRCLPYSPVSTGEHSGEVLQPWLLLDDGRYDLTEFAPEWEARLRDYLQMALDRRIVVSLEVWDDWSLTRGPGGAHNPGEDRVWNIHPFNPENNVNYDDSVLPATAERCNPPFYRSIPTQDDNPTVLVLQQHYVNKLLEIAADYPNAFINISNESRASLEWSRYWAAYIREHAVPGTLISDMPSTNRQDGRGECDPELNPLTLSTDPLYDLVDIAQGVSRHEFGSPQRQALGGGERIRMYRQTMIDADTRRPLVVTKDYSNYGIEGDIVFWSRFVGGASSSRFHRPWGEHAEMMVQYQHEAAARLGRFIVDIPFWTMAPMQELVTQLPEGAGANVLAAPNGPIVIQLLDGAADEVLHVEAGPGTWSVRWYDPAEDTYVAQAEITAEGATLHLEIPAALAHWIIHLEQ